MNGFPTQKTLSQPHFVTNKMWSHSSEKRNKQTFNISNIRGHKLHKVLLKVFLFSEFSTLKRYTKGLSGSTSNSLLCNSFLNSLCQCCLPEAVFHTCTLDNFVRIRLGYFPQLSFLICIAQQEIVSFRCVRHPGNTLCCLGEGAA